jgi:hypothetical protein
MRTTLSLDDDLAETLNRKARLSGPSFKEVVNAAIRRGLALGEQPAQTRGQQFVVHPQACGLMPGIDPLRFNQLLDQLDLEQFQAVQKRDGGPS